MRELTLFSLSLSLRFTYNWNMRELTNIFQGMVLSKPEFFETGTSLVRLFVHEADRVIKDRLINATEIAAFDTMVEEMVKKGCKCDMNEVLSEPRIYTQFAVGTAKALRPVPDLETLSKVLNMKLMEYNESNAVMELVLFNNAMEHICRICRILDNPGGNAMLIGVGGSGKQSLSRLAAFIAGFEVVQLAVTGAYKVEDLMEALKEMFKTATIKNTPLVWLMTDSQIVNDKFLIFINSINLQCT